LVTAPQLNSQTAYKEANVSTESEKSINQKQGVINKCPNCGGALKAFSSKCDLCGHELAGVGPNRTITDLVEKFDEIEAEITKAGLTGGAREKELITRKARVIRDFPIPNSREDLQSLIYFIHPKIQDNIKPDPNAEDWRVKFREVLNLAKNAYKGDAKTRAEFEEIERSLNTTISGSLQTRAKRSPIVAIGVGVVVILVIVGVISSQMDKWKLSQCQDKYAQGAITEKARLDAIVASSDSKQKEKKYAEALTSLNQLRWEYQEPCKVDEANLEKAQWEAKRKELVSLIQKNEASEATSNKEAADRELAQKNAEAEQALADKLTEKVKEASASRKSATNKEW
jgi:ribosomal protein L37AE/L43A